MSHPTHEREAPLEIPTLPPRFARLANAPRYARLVIALEVRGGEFGQVCAELSTPVRVTTLPVPSQSGYYLVRALRVSYPYSKARVPLRGLSVATLVVRRLRVHRP